MNFWRHATTSIRMSATAQRDRPRKRSLRSSIHRNEIREANDGNSNMEERDLFGRVVPERRKRGLDAFWELLFRERRCSGAARRLQAETLEAEAFGSRSFPKPKSL